MFERQSANADRVLNALKSPYVKATLEFMEFVFEEFSGLTCLFQSDTFQLHRLYSELRRVIKMFSLNFLKRSCVVEGQLHLFSVDDNSIWLPCEQVYPGLKATETTNTLLPHQRESFLDKCRNWYREATKQLCQRIDLENPVLQAMQYLHPSAIVEGRASVSSAAKLAAGLPHTVNNLEATPQTLDRQWRFIFVDDTKISGEWSDAKIEDFWNAMNRLEPYRTLASHILHVTALPQSSAVVERTFSKINSNKTKLRNCLGIKTLEAILKVSDNFPDNFPVTHLLAHLYGKARKSYMEKYSEGDRRDVEEGQDNY